MHTPWKESYDQPRYILSYLLLQTMGCFSGHLMSSASDQKLFCEICSAFNWSLHEFVGEKMVSPSYSSTILAPPPTNLDSILKSRGITLPTKVRVVKAMVFHWSCMDVRVELWRELSAEELMLLNCGVGEDSWESLGLQGDPTSPS